MTHNDSLFSARQDDSEQAPRRPAFRNGGNALFSDHEGREHTGAAPKRISNDPVFSGDGTDGPDRPMADQAYDGSLDFSHHQAQESVPAHRTVARQGRVFSEAQDRRQGPRQEAPAGAPVMMDAPDDTDDQDEGVDPKYLAQYVRLKQLLVERIQPTARKQGFKDDEILHALTNPIATVPDPNSYSCNIVLGYTDKRRIQPIQLNVGKQGSRHPMEITGSVRPFREEYLPLYRDDETAFCERHQVTPRPMRSMKAIRQGMEGYSTMPVDVHERTLVDFIKSPIQQDAAPVTHRRTTHRNPNGPITVARRVEQAAARLHRPEDGRSVQA